MAFCRGGKPVAPILPDKAVSGPQVLRHRYGALQDFNLWTAGSDPSSPDIRGAESSLDGRSLNSCGLPTASSAPDTIRTCDPCPRFHWPIAQLLLGVKAIGVAPQLLIQFW